MGDRSQHTHGDQLHTGRHKQYPAVRLPNAEPFHEVPHNMNRNGVDKLVDSKDESPGNLRRIQTEKTVAGKVWYMETSQRKMSARY